MAPDTQLKRYFLKPGVWEEFLQVWEEMVVLRKRLQFEVLFAFIDDDQEVFTWAVSHKGDFEAATRGYYAAPEFASFNIAERFLIDADIADVSRHSVP